MLFQVGDSPNPGLTELIARFSEVRLSSKKIRLSKISKPEDFMHLEIMTWRWGRLARRSWTRQRSTWTLSSTRLTSHLSTGWFHIWWTSSSASTLEIIKMIIATLEQIRGRSHNSHLQPDCPVDSGENISHLSFSFGHLWKIYLTWQISTLTGEKAADDQWGAVGGFQAAWGQWGP